MNEMVFIKHVVFHLFLLMDGFKVSSNFLFLIHQASLTCLLIPTPGCGTKTKYKPGLLGQSLPTIAYLVAAVSAHFWSNLSSLPAAWSEPRPQCKDQFMSNK